MTERPFLALGHRTQPPGTTQRRALAKQDLKVPCGSRNVPKSGVLISPWSLHALQQAAYPFKEGQGPHYLEAHRTYQRQIVGRVNRRVLPLAGLTQATPFIRRVFGPLTVEV